MLPGAGLLAAALVVSCGEERRPPGAPTPPTPRLTVLAVRIAGPASVHPGTSAQFTAMLELGDGTARAATGARWFTGNGTVLHIDANTGVAASRFADVWGQTTLGVEVSLAGTGLTGQTRGSREILVMPDGTFRIVGVVTEEDGSGIPDAALEVRLTENLSSRPVTGARADATGRYALYGVPAESYLHVRRAGYLPVTERIQTGSHTTRDFTLRVDSKVPSFAGTYTMTVDATLCTGFSPLLEPQYRLRTYTATIKQAGARLTVGLSDAPFPPGSDAFSGVATPTGADVQLRSFYGSYYFNPTSYPLVPEVAERLDDGTFLETSGRARLTGTPDRLSGTVDMLRHWGSFEAHRFLGGCSQPRITLVDRR